MKRTIALVLTIAICATMALGGTLAFLTDTEEEVNIMTVGRVDIVLHEEQRDYDENGALRGLTDFRDGQQLLPVVGSAQGEKDEYGMPIAKNYMDKIVNVENVGNTSAYVRVIVGIPAALEKPTANENILHWNYGNRFDPEAWGQYNGDDWNPQYDEIVMTENLGAVTMHGIEYNLYTFTYTKPLGAKEQTYCPAIIGCYLDERLDWNDETNEYHINGEVVHYDFNRGVVIPVMAQAVQADGFDSAEEAFAASGLPEVPWENGNHSIAIPAVVSSEDELRESMNNGAGLVMMSNNMTIYDQVQVGGGATLDGNGYSIDSRLEFGENEYTEPAVFVDNGTVQNLGVFGPGRGIGTRGSLNGGLWVSNVITDSGNYAFHVGNGGGWFMEIRDSEFHGWVSFGPGFRDDPESVLFENVNFVPNSDPSKDKMYNGVRAYDEATFRGCHFQDVTFDLADSFKGEVIFENCTWSVEGGVWELLTADNVAELLKVDAEEATRIIFHND